MKVFDIPIEEFIARVLAVFVIAWLVSLLWNCIRFLPAIDYGEALCIVLICNMLQKSRRTE